MVDCQFMRYQSLIFFTLTENSSVGTNGTQGLTLEKSIPPNIAVGTHFHVGHVTKTTPQTHN